MITKSMAPWRSPRVSLVTFPEDLDRIFGGLLGRPHWLTEERMMPIDLVEKDAEYELKAEMPGFEPKDIAVTLKDSVLTIKAKRTSEKQEEEEIKGKKPLEAPRYLWHERTSTQMLRQVQMPSDAKADGLEAVYSHGVLTVAIPRHASDTKEVKVPVHAAHGYE
jgi:HSP20 family protein